MVIKKENFQDKYKNISSICFIDETDLNNVNNIFFQLKLQGKDCDKLIRKQFTSLGVPIFNAELKLFGEIKSQRDFKDIVDCLYYLENVQFKGMYELKKKKLNKIKQNCMIIAICYTLGLLFLLKYSLQIKNYV
tara:strand:+ start:4147 stop:4548 length:402 start_codon:yes stop_codon:yes gene_type:complete